MTTRRRAADHRIDARMRTQPGNHYATAKAVTAETLKDAGWENVQESKSWLTAEAYVEDEAVSLLYAKRAAFYSVKLVFADVELHINRTSQDAAITPEQAYEALVEFAEGEGS